MKTKDLIELLERNGWKFKRHGANHDIYVKDGQRESVVRHRETDEELAKAIIKRRGLMMASPVQNKTSEYFDTKMITDTILVQLQKNGVRYVIEGEGMQNQVDELRRQNQSGLYDKSKTVKMGKMQGAKFRLDGSVSSIIKKTADLKDAYYKINLRLIEIETYRTFAMLGLPEAQAIAPAVNAIERDLVTLAGEIRASSGLERNRDMLARLSQL